MGSLVRCVNNDCGCEMRWSGGESGMMIALFGELGETCH